MNNSPEAKGACAAIVGVTGYLFNCFSSMTVIFILCMIIDYITGIISAALHGELSSCKGLTGALKKFLMFFLLLVAFLFDKTLILLAESIGIQYTTAFFGVATTVWLISTELISILENLDKIGVKIPPFLKSAFAKMQEKVEKESEGKDI